MAVTSALQNGTCGGAYLYDDTPTTTAQRARLSGSVGATFCIFRSRAPCANAERVITKPASHQRITDVSPKNYKRILPPIWTSAARS